MRISLSFFFIFGVLMIISIIYGLISGYRLNKVPKSESPNIRFIITELCGEEGSKNTDFRFADVIANQNIALSVTLKLMRKEVNPDDKTGV